MVKYCPKCDQELIEVDNPLRREFRHKRGTECEYNILFSPKQIIHLTPRGDAALTGCCQKSIMELPRTDRLTLYSNLVTCESYEIEQSKRRHPAYIETDAENAKDNGVWCWCSNVGRDFERDGHRPTAWCPPPGAHRLPSLTARPPALQPQTTSPRASMKKSCSTSLMNRSLNG